MGDLQQNLLAQLKQSSNSNAATVGSSSYKHPSVSSEIGSPTPSGTPARQSTTMSQDVTSAGQGHQADTASSDRAANLLNLLRFNQPPPRSNSQSAIPVVGQNGDVERPASVASPTERPANLPLRPSSERVPTQAARAGSRASTDNPQDMLLNLLKRSESSTKPAEKSSTSDDQTASEKTPTKPPGIVSPKASPLPVSQHASKGGMFSYVNPFDQLHATAPRTSSPKIGADSGRGSVKATSPAPPGLPDGRTQLEALMGIGAKKQEPKPVTEALNSVAQQADKEMQEALEIVEADTAIDELAQQDPEKLKDAVHEAAIEVQDELKDGKTKKELEETISKPVTEALLETADAVAQEAPADSWESADGEGDAEKEGDPHTVQVYNLPMRPFVSLDIKGNSTSSKVRSDIVMRIASLKKEFDQIDRTLATASANHIVYAMASKGGFRIIRQEDGSNKTVFRGPENQIFNVSITQPKTRYSTEDEYGVTTESILATGVNGSVYWTDVPIAEGSVEDLNLDKRGFIMPPLPSTDENTSTSQLKTRAKKSSRHPEFFAVGRGKSIYLVWPSIAGTNTYTNDKSRVVDTQKYLHQRCFKIATGKAGKDFAFSEDDTVIVSLDKHGRIKFWDIIEHQEMAKTNPSRPASVEAKVPITTFWLTSSNAKAWPTSVQFVDKERPTTKGIALRYLVVGLKQNHTIQLWDLGLGKAVQEINLPHASETDAICSIAYHAKSGIIVVGHPTRNSIYLIHLSAPKYIIPAMSQSSFMRGLAQKEERIPRPESTAIMSGLREISLASIGDLRSVDIISPTSHPPAKDDPQEDETVFEAYVMHSRGVTCLNLKKQDFGWGADGKVTNGRDAESEGIIAVTELPVGAAGETAPNDDSKTTETPKKTLVKPSSQGDSTARREDHLPLQTPTKSGAATPSKAEKKRSEKKRPETPDEPSTAASKIPSYAAALSRGPAAEMGGSKPMQPNAVTANGTTISSAPPAETAVPTLATEASLPSAFAKILSEQMENLYKRMDEERRVQEAAGAARQEAVLRLVSATLTENVERSLNRIVSNSIEDKVLPAVSKAAVSALEAQVPNTIASQISRAIPSALQKSVPDAVTQSLQSSGALQPISDHVVGKLNENKKYFSSVLQSNVVPAIQKAATDGFKTSSTELEQRLVEQLRATEQKLQYDAIKIDQLTKLTSELTGTVTDMANIQTQLHTELAGMRSEMRQLREATNAATQAGQAHTAELAAAATPIKQEEKDAKDVELEVIADAMANGQMEEGTIRWLQSAHQSYVFDNLLATMSPQAFLPQLQPIVLLSVSAAISNSLAHGHAAEKLTYLETIMDSVDPKDAEIAEYAPRMMEVLNERLSDEYMRVAEERPGDATLTRMSTLVRRVRAFKNSASPGS